MDVCIHVIIHSRQEKKQHVAADNRPFDTNAWAGNEIGRHMGLSPEVVSILKPLSLIIISTGEAAAVDRAFLLLMGSGWILTPPRTVGAG